MDGADAARPTKRPRLSDQTRTVVGRDIHTELVGKLHDLMGLERAADLDALSRVALCVGTLLTSSETY